MIARLLIAALALLLSCTARAEPVRVLSMEEAIALALDHNSALLQAQIAASLAGLDVGEARSRFLPRLTLGASSVESDGRIFSEREGRIVEDTIRSANLSASSEVILFNGFGDIAALRGAKLERESRILVHERQRETVCSTVAAGFVGVLRAGEQLRVQRDSLGAELELERRIAIYVEGGSRTRADLYTQQVSVANARMALTDTERNLGLARMDLMRTLGLPSGTPYEIATSVDEAAGQAMIDVEERVASALARRKDLAAEQARLASVEQGIRAARAARWPMVSIGAGYGSGHTDASPLSDREQLDLNRNSAISIDVRLSLFDGGRTGRAIRRAELEARSAGVALDEARREVVQQVRRAHLDYQTAQKQLSLAQAGRHAAALALEIAEDRYRLGAGSLVELSQARSAHTGTESAWVTARHDLRLRRVLLDHATGEGPSLPR